MSEVDATDVLVLGAGPGGLFTAWVAAQSGASVTIVEPTGELGGNGAFSTGYMAFANSSMQREAGIEDSAELFLRDLVKEVETGIEEQGVLEQPDFDVDLAFRFASESGQAFEDMTNLGFQFGRFVPRPRQHSVDRMVALTDPGQFRDALSRVLHSLGVKVKFRHRALEFITSGGQLSGVVLANEKSEHVEQVADRAIVVATGGYQGSVEVRRRFRPDQDPTSSFKGLDTSIGDGHQMLEKAGADLINMPVIPQQVQVASRFVEECIAVNEDGRRFEDEAGPYGERMRLLLEQPGGVGYYICDARSADRYPQLIAEMPLPPKRFNSVAEIARAIDCPVAELASTIDRWNEAVESGVNRDPEFGRVIFPDPRIGIREPPYAVIPMAIGVSPTVGGAKVTVDMEVQRANGDVIPRLLAVGDCIGAVNSAAGLGGVHLASAVTLGRVAGRTAASM
jgi:succinate dehydrogenase/fumarate reductase flavoprotein subunit